VTTNQSARQGAAQWRAHDHPGPKKAAWPPGRGHGLTSSTKQLVHSLFDKGAGALRESARVATPGSFARCPSRRQCRDGPYRAVLSALRRLPSASNTAGVQLSAVGQRQNRPVQCPGPPPKNPPFGKPALSPVLDPLRPMPCVAAVATIAACMRPASGHFGRQRPIPPPRWPKALNGPLAAHGSGSAAAEVPFHLACCYFGHLRRYRYTLL